MKRILVRNFENDECKILLGKCIGSGSNSYVYQCEEYNSYSCDSIVAKCTKTPTRYSSFQLQYEAMLKCSKMKDENIVIVSPIFWGISSELGEVLIMNEMTNLYSIDFIINNGFYYGDFIIRNIAKAIAFLHNNNISGYDIELFWDALYNRLVILDIGPLYTFNVNYETMVKQHWESLKCNRIGRWNMLSQIVPINRAEEVKNNDVFADELLEELLYEIDERTMELHLENVAKIHAINIIGKLNKTIRKQYLKLFKKVYLEEIGDTQFANVQYLNYFERTFTNKKISATAKLYYSKSEIFCKMSCSSSCEWI